MVSLYTPGAVPDSPSTAPCWRQMQLRQGESALKDPLSSAFLQIPLFRREDLKQRPCIRSFRTKKAWAQSQTETPCPYSPLRGSMIPDEPPHPTCTRVSVPTPSALRSCRVLLGSSRLPLSDLASPPAAKVCASANGFALIQFAHPHRPSQASQCCHPLDSNLHCTGLNTVPV